MIRRTIKRHLKIFIASCILLSFLSLNSQERKLRLQDEKEQIEKEINYANNLLKSTKSNRETSLEELILLTKKIEQRQFLVSSISKESYETLKFQTDELENASINSKNITNELSKTINDQVDKIAQASSIIKEETNDISTILNQNSALFINHSEKLSGKYPSHCWRCFSKTLIA